ncbi:solute carrier family 22 member 18 isoform X8 [Orcinus orca]|uniref:solute carrier family 22 member 18 isoform X8 n=1 Tax=Orcinus orca TaxID=9733 RepID=UPI00211343FA|nr:solute carrier family 22 member 18 isoform X8 [Orcinus orca]
MCTAEWSEPDPQPPPTLLRATPPTPCPWRTPDCRCWGPSRPFPWTPPMFQYLSRRLGLDSVAFGYQQTIFGVLQLLGGPVFGRFADQRGARAAFTLSFLASSALYLLLAAACSPALPGVPLLFASRLPGALMHTLPAAQMAITDLSAPEERPAALGRLGLCFGVGVIFGSLLGGTLSSTCGIQCPVIVALVVSLLGAVLSLTCIPTSTKGASARAQAALPGKPKASVFDLKAITCLLLQPGVLPVFLVKVICGFPSGLFMVMFSLISMDFFQLEAAQAGYLMSFFGVLQMVPSCMPAFRVLHPHLSFWLVLLSLLAAPTPGSVCPPICPEVPSERGEGRLIRSGGWRALGLPLGNTAEAHVRRVSIWAPAVDRSGRGQTPVVGRVTRRMVGLCVPPACPPVA